MQHCLACVVSQHFLQLQYKTIFAASKFPHNLLNRRQTAENNKNIIFPDGRKTRSRQVSVNCLRHKQTAPLPQTKKYNPNAS